MGYGARLWRAPSLIFGVKIEVYLECFFYTYERAPKVTPHLWRLVRDYVAEAPKATD